VKKPAPKLEIKKSLEQIFKSYISSCMDGLFLRHIFCKYVPLKWYLLFMAVIDLFLVLVDISSIFSKVIVYSSIESPRDRAGLLLAIVFFGLKVLLYLPILILTIKVFQKSKQTSGKWLYGLKLTCFFIFLFFNSLGLIFVTDEGCNVLHTKIYTDKMKQAQTQDAYEPDCSLSIQLSEIIGMFLYHFFTCWVILSVLHWIRRATRNGNTGVIQDSDVLGLISYRGRNPIVLNHSRHRPLVKDSQLQAAPANAKGR
jgi:hypothetical protein